MSAYEVEQNLENEPTTTRFIDPTQVESAELPHQNWNIYLIFVCLVFVIASFQFGYATGVINSPRVYIQCGNNTAINGTQPKHPEPVEPSEPGFWKECIPMSDFQWDVMVAMFTVGGLVGGLGGGVIADVIGRRNLTLINNVFFIIAYVLMTFFSNFYVISVGRFFVGLGAGICSSVVPMYLSEISPVKLRGAIGVLPQLGIVVGILASQVLAVPLAGRPWQWRVLLGWITVLPIIQIILLPFCPESPKWLLIKRKDAAGAEKAYQRLRRSNDVSLEFEQVRKSELGDAGAYDVQKVSFFTKLRALFRRELWKPLLVGIGLQMAQQLSGVNVVFAYSTSIFTNAGLGDFATLCTVMVGLVNVISTIIVVPLMDRLGRKLLLLIGEVGCFVFFGTLALCFILQHYAVTAFGIISVICVIGFVISFAIALGPIPWLIISEIFPSDVRPIAVSIAVAVNWTCNFIILLTFGSLSGALKQYTFLPYTGIILISIIFTALFVMETKGKTVEQITGLQSAVQTDERKSLLLNQSESE
jgi:sugar porter (SP) family MFS transporter